MAKHTTGERAIHVLVADGQRIVRKGVCALLASEPDIEVVGEAATPANDRRKYIWYTGDRRDRADAIALGSWPVDDLLRAGCSTTHNEVIP